MNWLAHILLAGPNADDRLGGVLADMLSLSEARRMPTGIQRGIALHQSIDAFGDAHPAACASNRRLTNAGVGLRPAAAGIAVDMLYDHLLARDWERHCPATSLAGLAAEFYRAAAAMTAPIPPKVRHGLNLMRAENWLESYRDPAEIRAVLGRIRGRLSPRAAEVSPLPAAMDVFAHDPRPFEADFARFWPDMVAHAEAFLARECSESAEKDRPAFS